MGEAAHDRGAGPRGVEVNLAVVLAKAGTHTPCPLDRLRSMGPGSVSAFTRIFDALRAGTTLVYASIACPTSTV
jgi:hypothetical protein